jgi:hypothetical protein
MSGEPFHGRTVRGEHGRFVVKDTALVRVSQAERKAGA